MLREPEVLRCGWISVANCGIVIFIFSDHFRRKSCGISAGSCGNQKYVAVVDVRNTIISFYILLVACEGIYTLNKKS